MRTVFSVLLLLLTFSASAQDSAENEGRPAYVSDELFIYMHSGAGSQYKIVGSVNAGDSIRVLEERETYTQIVDPKGRIAWIESRFISGDTSAKVRLQSLEEKQDQLLINIEQLQQDVNLKDDQLSKQKNKQSDLAKSINSLKSENKKLQVVVDNQVHQQQMDWFIKGGAIALAGVFLGIILPFFIRKKPKHSGWA